MITLMPGPNGYPDLDALKAAVSERTAGLMMTNPEDTGIFNPHVEEFTRIVHEAGGLCAYDQANANGILGVTRARDNGFDLCQFNLHKTFSVPHGSTGGSCGAGGCTAELAKYLPAPMVVFDGERYAWDYDRPESIGKIRSFHGNVQAVLRSYAWVMAHGAEGLKQVAETAVLNNNYLQSTAGSRSRGSRFRTAATGTACRRFAIAGSRCSTKPESAPRMCAAGSSTLDCRATSPVIIR